MKLTVRSLVLSAIGFLPFAVQADQAPVRCVQPDGKVVFQNWPCGTNPAIEKEAPRRPDYAKIVKCSMQASADNMARRAAGQNPAPVDCAKK